MDKQLHHERCWSFPICHYPSRDYDDKMGRASFGSNWTAYTTPTMLNYSQGQHYSVGDYVISDANSVP